MIELSDLVQEIRELCWAIKVCKAYDLVDRKSCKECGLPATRVQYRDNGASQCVCDTCLGISKDPKLLGEHELHGAAAVRLLTTPRRAE